MVNNSKVGRTKSFGRSVDPSTFVPSEDSNRASSDVHYYNYLLTIEEKPKCFVLEQPVRPSKGKESKAAAHTALPRDDESCVSPNTGMTNAYVDRAMMRSKGIERNGMGCGDR